jgi:cation:H+ antiporter
MLGLILWITLFIIGYLTIFFAADVFLDNLKEICIIYGISPFIIGALIIGIDPEESIASIIAALNGLSYIAVGNVIGNSVIALTISFAIPAFFYQINFKSVPQFYFLLLYMCLFLLLFGLFFNFGLLFVGIIVIFLYIVYLIRNVKNISFESDLENNSVENTLKIEEKIKRIEWKQKLKKIIYILISFIFIFLGGEFLIISTENIMIQTQIPETLFGFVIIAFVTNVEELTLVLKSIKKKSLEIGLGGMIGKVFWNLTLTFGISAIIIMNLNILWILIWNWFILLSLIVFFNWRSKKESLDWKSGIILIIFLISFFVINFTLV